MLEYQKQMLQTLRDIEGKPFMFDLRRTLVRRKGKSMSVIAFCSFALTRHPTVIVATSDQAGTITKLREHFPRNWIDTVDGGVRIHRGEGIKNV